jgi:hypothetical protein
MPLITPTYLVDSPSHQQWLIGVDNNAALTATPVTGMSASPYIRLNSVTDGTSWQVSIVGNPPPAGLNWGDFQTTSISQGSYPTQLLLTAPNGTVYAMQVATIGPPLSGSVATGILQTALPVNTAPLTCVETIGTLAPEVLERLEDPTGIFWSQQFEICTGLVEAMNDLLLLVGRPTQTVGMQFNLTPNTSWQYLPKGLFLISDIWGPQSRLRKYNLFSYDYEQPGSMGSDWENDVSDSGPTSWAPLGLNMFVVHPASTVPQTVLLDGVAYPVAETNFPYSGSEVIPFHHEFGIALEDYTCVYTRLKESGAELQEALPLYQNYLSLAKRLSEIEDRRDDLIFSKSMGAPAGIGSHTKR